MTFLIPQTPSGGGITLQGAWKFDTAIDATDPGNKSFKFDNATLANITNIYISEITDNNNDASNILGILAVGNRLYIQQSNDAARAVLVQVSGSPVDNTGWWTIPVTVVNSLTLMQNNNTSIFVIDLSGAGAVVSSGTFTPTVVDASFDPNEGQTYGSQSGRYRRSGDVVDFWLQFFFTDAGTLDAGGPVSIRGLPFDHGLASPEYTSIIVGNYSGLAIGAGESLNAYMFGDTNVDYVQVFKADATAGLTALTVAELSTSSRITLSGRYITSDP